MKTNQWNDQKEAYETVEVEGDGCPGGLQESPDEGCLIVDGGDAEESDNSVTICD